MTLRIATHEANVNALLALRDEIMPILKSAMAKSKPLILAEMNLSSGHGFSDITQFLAQSGNIPAEYLPADTECAFVERSASAQEAIAHLHQCCGILGTMRKTPVAMAPQKALREDL